MSDHEKLHLARLRKDQDTFEVVVDPDLAMELKEGKDMPLSDVLKSDIIFFDAKKGQEASAERLKAKFGTEDNNEIAKAIIKEGDIQLSAEFREKKREEKRKKIISIIHRNGIDPKTNLPHPQTRIENAIEEAKVRVDESKSVEHQVDKILKELKAILPIKFVLKEIEVKVPAEHAGRLYGNIISFGKVLRDSWQDDGSWDGVIEIPGGLETDFYDKVNSLASGNVEMKVIKIKE